MQLADLIGEMSDPPQRELLSAMWCDMIADLDRELLELDALKSDAEMVAALHRLRGFISMWGFREVAYIMQGIERKPAALAEWSRSKSIVCAAASTSRSEIINRHPWLGRAGGT
jgi:hypothetical protein